jgi:hypothetical protein
MELKLATAYKAQLHECSDPLEILRREHHLWYCIMVIGGFSKKTQRLSPSPTSNKYPCNNTWMGGL